MSGRYYAMIIPRSNRWEWQIRDGATDRVVGSGAAAGPISATKGATAWLEDTGAYIAPTPIAAHVDTAELVADVTAFVRSAESA